MRSLANSVADCYAFQRLDPFPSYLSSLPSSLHPTLELHHHPITIFTPPRTPPLTTPDLPLSAATLRADVLPVATMRPSTTLLFLLPLISALPAPQVTTTDYDPTTYYDPNVPTTDNLALPSTTTEALADPTPTASSTELAETGTPWSDGILAAPSAPTWSSEPYKRSLPSTLPPLTSTTDAAPTPTTTPSPLNIEKHKRAPSPVVLISVATLPCCDPDPTAAPAADAKAKRDCISCETKVEAPGSFVATFQEVSGTYEEIFEDLLPNHSEKRDVAERSGDGPGHRREIRGFVEDDLDLMLQSTTATSTTELAQSTDDVRYPASALTGQLNGMIDEFPPHHSKREVAAGGASAIEGLSEEERKYLETLRFDDSVGDDLIVRCDSALSRSHREETASCPASPPLLRRTTISDEYNHLNPLFPDRNPLNPLIKGKPTDATVRAASYARNYLFYAQFYLKKLQREAADAQRNVAQQVSLGRPAVREKAYLEKKKKAMVGFDARVQHLAEEAERLSVAADGAVLGGTAGTNDEGFLGR